MTCDEAQVIADMIDYKDWKCVVVSRANACVLKWVWRAPCTRTGRVQTWESREWLLPFPVTDEGLVRTAFAAAKMAEEHECAENFKFAGRRIFDPHRDLLG